MHSIVSKFRLFIPLLGLISIFSCNKASDASEQSKKRGKDSLAIAVNQKPQKTASLEKAIQIFVQDKVNQHANISIAIMDNASSQLIADYQSDLTCIPASSLKIFTTATGLAILGNDYRFKTEIVYDGNIENGTLNGNLYIKGFGDPTLGSDNLEGASSLETTTNAFVTAIQKAGIRAINGHIVGDASYLPTAVSSPTWTWDDLGNYYAAGAWGLNFHENLYYLNFNKNARLGGKPSIIATQPKMTDMVWTNELTSGERGSGDNAYIYGAPYTNRRFVRGTIPMGTGTFKIKGAIPNPPLFAARHLQENLQKAGISIRKTPITNLELDAKKTTTKTIYIHESPPLFEMAKACNLKSVNLYAEAILRAIGKQQKGKGDLQSGIESVLEYWSNKGFDSAGFFMEDGSGLSPRNGASAKHFCQLLYLISKDKHYTDFKNSLAIGGKTGTLKLMFKGTAAEGKIWGKSGSIGRVRSYTGYAQTPSGKMRSFAVIANNYTCSNSEMRKKMEALIISFCQD